MLPLFLLPALVLQAPVPPVLEATEVLPGFFVLKAAPTAAMYAALKSARITHVVNLRRDGEPGFDSEAESTALSEVGVAYVRLTMGKTPTQGDLDLFRMIIGDLPRGARILVHCGDGNRAAGALCTWLVLDKGMKLEAATALSKRAGLALPETEEAIRKYVGSKLRS